MSKLSKDLYGHYGLLLFAVFSELEDYVEDNRGHIPQAAKYSVEAGYISFYTTMLDPEICIEASTLKDIPQHYIDNSEVFRQMYNIAEKLEAQDFSEDLMTSAQYIVRNGSSAEIDYVVSQLYKVTIACGLVQSFVSDFYSGSIGREIINWIAYYREQLSK